MRISRMQILSHKICLSILCRYSFFSSVCLRMFRKGVFSNICLNLVIPLILLKMEVFRKNRPFSASNGSKSGFREWVCLIMSYFFLTLCLKLYLDTLEHKSYWFLWVNLFLCRFWLFRGPRTLHFGGLSLYFDKFFVRKTVGNWETACLFVEC